MATCQDPAGRERLVPISKVGRRAAASNPFSPSQGLGSCYWSVPLTHDSARTSGLEATMPRQGVLEGRVVRSKTQSHWFPNGNKIL